MRTTSTCFLCVLLVAVCWAQPSHKDKKGLLMQAINYLTLLNNKDHKIFLHSPTNSIKECCSQSALECFRNEIMKLNMTGSKDDQKLIQKLTRNLKKPAITNSVKTCTDEDIKKVECMSCSSYPKVNSKDFLVNLRSLMQKAVSLL